MKFLHKPLQTGLGVTAGTLIYTGLISPARDFDFMRAALVGLSCGLGVALMQRIRRR